jgi:hypothetical protein
MYRDSSPITIFFSTKIFLEKQKCLGILFWITYKDSFYDGKLQIINSIYYENIFLIIKVIIKRIVIIFYVF